MREARGRDETGKPVHIETYFRLYHGKVDFIWQASEGEDWQLIQVCETLAHADTRKRELSALLEAMQGGMTVLT